MHMFTGGLVRFRRLCLKTLNPIAQKFKGTMQVEWNTILVLGSRTQFVDTKLMHQLNKKLQDIFSRSEASFLIFNILLSL